MMSTASAVRSVCRIAALTLWLVPAGVSGQAVYVAAKRPDGAVDLKLRSGAVETAVDGLFANPEWVRFDLRTAERSSGEELGGVQEIRGETPRLQVRSDYQLVACHSLTSEAAALAAIGPWGLRVLLRSSDERYHLEEDGAFLAPGGGHLGLVFHGTKREEMAIVDLRAATPGVRLLLLPAAVERVEAESLVLTRRACFLVGRVEEGGFVLCRAPLDPEGGASSIAAEVLAGPLDRVERRLASSDGAAAWIAGSTSDALDVFVARETGPAVNVTVQGGTILESKAGNNRLAVADDGSTVAYNLEVGGQPEVFVHQVAVPGLAGRQQITADRWFNPYIDQEVWVFFSPGGDLVFAAGHDPVTTDVFRINAALPEWAVNLTHTGTVEPGPLFATKGSLRVDAIAMLGDAAVISTEGLAGTGTGGVYVVDLATGEELASKVDLAAATGFFSLGEDLYFTGTLPSTEGGFYRLTIGPLPAAETLGEVARAPAGSSPSLLFLSADRALVSVPGAGLFDLRPGLAPRQIATISSASASVALDAAGRYAVIARSLEDGTFAFVRIDLTTGAETTLFTQPGLSDLLAAAQVTLPFLRGDASGDGHLDLTDAVQTLEFLFVGGRQLSCLDAADADDDGDLLITDAVRILIYLFAGGAPLPEPFTAAGDDPTPDLLGECFAAGN